MGLGFKRGLVLVALAAMLVSLSVADDSPASFPQKITAPAIKEDNASITNSLGMKLLMIRAGNFRMGASDTDKLALPKERPQHRVWISKGFYLGKFEVTRGEFRKFVTATGYQAEVHDIWDTGARYTGNKQVPFERGQQWNWEAPGFGDDNHPVVNVNWYDAVEFCKWLSQTEGRTYRLPTEAEWEWACRGGTIERWSFGDDEKDLAAHANILDASTIEKFDAAGVVNWNDAAPFTSEPGKFKANPFGLHDMHGNVLEWCSDWFDASYYARSPVKDPRGLVTGTQRAIRGGCWFLRPIDCRSSCRGGAAPGARNFNLGFRVVCVPPVKN